MDSPGSSHPLSPAAAAFAEYLARREDGEEVDFEAFCAERPELAPRLRRLHLNLSGLSLTPDDDAGAGLDEADLGHLERLVLPQEGRYEVHGEVARGGMGAILEIRDRNLHRSLAMKVLLGSGPAARVDPRSLARFIDEAQVTGQLEHPGIVPVHELGLDRNGRVYFTMQLVRGRSFSEILELARTGREDWTVTRALEVVVRVCECVAFAHSKGVIHRDLKPSNVMIGAFGETYVMDWGLARILGQADRRDIRLVPSSEVRSLRQQAAEETPESSLMTQDGDVVGTPAYMPPEQADGEVEAMGPASDVYAIGAMLYHLLAGHRPYAEAGKAQGPVDVLHAVRTRAPRPLADVDPTLPPELVAICEKAMARAPASRYAATLELARDLRAFLEGRVVAAYRTGPWVELAKWVKRNRSLAAALGAALVLALGGLASTTYVQAKGRRAEREQRERADARTAEVLRLSDVKRLQELLAEADGLWPPHPSRITALRAWIGRAEELVSNLPLHRATLTEMRRGALSWSPWDRALDRETHPRAAELPAKRTEIEELLGRMDAGLGEEELAVAEKHLDELESELGALQAALESRRTWRFAAPEEGWQHDVLAELIEGLEDLETELLAEDSVGPDHSWSVRKRLAFARELEAGFGARGGYGRVWAQALPAIRDAYPDLELEPRMGLVPLGPDPESGLWEFAHLMTGEPAARDDEGRLVLAETTGVVLVLVPAGSFWMGAQPDDPDLPNHDPLAEGDEGPVHEVQLSAFFLSKHEMTQGQWRRLTGRNPSEFGPDGRWSESLIASRAAPSLLHPVEQVSWQECMDWLPRAGLTLPTEAQWEYGARAGTGTPWWTGGERTTLEGAANLADSWAKEHGAPYLANTEAWLDDGATVHAPIGSYGANGFGLHDVAGNLWEWCRDAYGVGDFYAGSPAVNPLATEGNNRVYRGGGFDDGAWAARSSCRYAFTASLAGSTIGLRPAAEIPRGD